MPRHPKVRDPKAKSPEKKSRLPRAPKDATYDWVDDRGEVKPRCRFCLAVVPLAKWWEHACPSQRPPL